MCHSRRPPPMPSTVMIALFQTKIYNVTKHVSITNIANKLELLGRCLKLISLKKQCNKSPEQTAGSEISKYLYTLQGRLCLSVYPAI